jgi:DNA-binding CsgD family transcriptional regulator
MPKHIRKGSTQPPPKPVESEATAQQLLRVLLGLAERSIAPQPVQQPDDNGEQVLIDMDCDGVRYLLIRMPAVVRKASVQLSPRELEIVRMVAQGHQNKIIAVVLNISSWTVCTHLRRIFAKLGVNSRAAMVARLAESGGIGEQRLHLPPSGYPSRAPTPVHL